MRNLDSESTTLPVTCWSKIDKLSDPGEVENKSMMLAARPISRSSIANKYLDPATDRNEARAVVAGELGQSWLVALCFRIGGFELIGTAISLGG